MHMSECRLFFPALLFYFSACSVSFAGDTVYDEQITSSKSSLNYLQFSMPYGDEVTEWSPKF